MRSAVVEAEASATRHSIPRFLCPFHSMSPQVNLKCNSASENRRDAVFGEWAWMSALGERMGLALPDVRGGSPISSSAVPTSSAALTGV
jgi:hypothetical protein